MFWQDPVERRYHYWLRVPRFVIDALSEQPGVSFAHQAVFYLASAYQARSYSQSSRKSKMPRAGVAFEFNGWQHYGPTEKFPDEKELKEAQARDLIKKALSDDHGVKLVTVTAVHLVPAEFVKLLPADLPRNCVDEDGPYFTALANLCVGYKDRAGTRPEPQKPRGLPQRQQATQPRTSGKK
jgi:hypothetical protein